MSYAALKSALMATAVVMICALGACALTAAAGGATADTLTGVRYARATAGQPFRETATSPRNSVVSVWSVSMATQIPLLVQSPADGDPAAPVLYLLNGSTGGEQGDDWTHATDANDFFAGKNVWTVTPIGGAASYYADWRHVDGAANFRFGVTSSRPLRWETFLTSELPRIFETRHGGRTGAARARAIAGISMSGTAVIRLAENHPGLYRAVGSYSGCADTASPAGNAIARSVALLPGGADASNMYGPPGDPEWAAQDPVINAYKLARGTPALWISAASGLPGPHDTPNDRRIAGNVGALADQIAIGGIDEAASRACTATLVRRLGELKIAAHVRFPGTGTHSWGYWQDQLHQSWPVFARALGI